VRAQLVDAADRVDDLLDRLGQLRLDLLGARAGEIRLHRHDGRIGFRHQVEPELDVGEGAEQDQRRRHHDGEHPPPDADAAGLHRALPSPRPRGRPRRPSDAGAASVSPPTRTEVPVASWLRLLDASVSPPFSPSAISSSLPCRAPSVTCCWRVFPFSITYTDETPASVEMASSGTASTSSSSRVCTVPFAKKPGFSTRSALSTSASTAKVRVVWSTAGLTYATL